MTRSSAPHFSETVVLPEYPAVRLYIFDADDTLRRTVVPEQPCPRRPGEWELLPGVSEKLRVITWGTAGARLGVASNQDHVAYGHLSADMARMLLAEMVFAATGHVPPGDALAFCPHSLETDCECRKPNPGLLLRVMRTYDQDPRNTLFVGNSPVDAEAARRASVAFAWAGDFFTVRNTKR